MQNVVLKIAYDGTRYLGWQATKDGPSIEATLQKNLEQILQHPTLLQAASRTDAGVHAAGQVVNFFTKKEIDLKRFAYSLNSLLPAEIRILEIEERSSDFHPTLDVAGKEYHYQLTTDPVQLPQMRLFSWHCPQTLNLKAMESAATHLIGKKDFATLRNFRKAQDEQDTVRCIESITLLPNQSGLTISIRGDNFLYKMVRNMVGLLVTVGKEELNPDAVPQIIASKDRTQAPLTAPAHGLSLYKVIY